MSLTLDPLALDQIFTGWSCLPPRSPFVGIEQLPPGHYALVNADRALQLHRWWQPDFSRSADLPIGTAVVSASSPAHPPTFQ